MKLNKFDRILMRIFKNYTYKIFCIGMRAGFEWEEEGIESE